MSLEKFLRYGAVYSIWIPILVVISTAHFIKFLANPGKREIFNDAISELKEGFCL